MDVPTLTTQERISERSQPTIKGFSPKVETAKADIHRVFWAIDLDSQNIETTLHDLESIPLFFSRIFPEAKLYPAHILDPEGHGWIGESPQAISERLHPVAQEALDWLTETAANETHVTNIAHPFIIDCNEVPLRASKRSLTRKLSRWANRFRSDVILVTSSNTSSHLPSFLSPSFIENILAESKLPLIVVPPAAKLDHKNISDLVFATDFSERCRKTYAATLGWAKQLKATVRLFNKYEPPLAPDIYSGSSLFGPTWPSFFNDETDFVFNPVQEFNESRLWLDWAHNQGVEASFHSDEAGLGAGRTIVQYAAQFESPLLVMSTCQGPMESGLWGSVTRDVLERATVPVLLLRA